jgi:hypothetical protein
VVVVEEEATAGPKKKNLLSLESNVVGIDLFKESLGSLWKMESVRMELKKFLLSMMLLLVLLALLLGPGEST